MTAALITFKILYAVYWHLLPPVVIGYFYHIIGVNTVFKTHTQALLVAEILSYDRPAR